MKNQFVYKRIIPPKEEGGEEKTVFDSFNVDCVVRSVTLEDDKVLVLLDDIHEREQEVPRPNRNGKISMRKERGTFQSEIFLEPEDGEKFRELTKIN